MIILNLFIDFINAILNFKIFNIELYAYLLTITIIVIIFKIIEAISK